MSVSNIDIAIFRQLMKNRKVSLSFVTRVNPGIDNHCDYSCVDQAAGNACYTVYNTVANALFFLFMVSMIMVVMMINQRLFVFHILQFKKD